MSVWLLCSEHAKVWVQRRSVSFWDTQTLVSRFNMRVFQFVAEKLPKLLAARLNIGKWIFEVWPYYHSNSDYTVHEQKMWCLYVYVNFKSYFGRSEFSLPLTARCLPSMYLLVSISTRTNSFIQLFLTF